MTAQHVEHAARPRAARDRVQQRLLAAQRMVQPAPAVRGAPVRDRLGDGRERVRMGELEERQARRPAGLDEVLGRLHGPRLQAVHEPARPVPDEAVDERPRVRPPAPPEPVRRDEVAPAQVRRRVAQLGHEEPADGRLRRGRAGAGREPERRVRDEIVDRERDRASLPALEEPPTSPHRVRPVLQSPGGAGTGCLPASATRPGEERHGERDGAGSRAAGGGPAPGGPRGAPVARAAVPRRRPRGPPVRRPVRVRRRPTSASTPARSTRASTSTACSRGPASTS